MSCGWKALQAGAAFVALVASAPAVTTGAGGVVWIMGWIGFTAMLVDASASCNAE